MSKRKTRIYRSNNRENFTIINNEILRRKDVSWKAKGILTYIMALPSDWEIYLEELQKHATDGRDSFRSGWKELEKAGYVIRYPVKEKGKIIEWRTEVRETLDTATFSPQTGFPQMEKPQMEKPLMENPKLLSTYSTKYLTKQSTNNTKSNSPAKAEPDIPFKEIVEFLNEKTNSNYRHTTKATQNLIKARVNDGFEVSDFKQVIDTKSSQWLNDKEMAKYLRPQTLFGTKFESYLNEQSKTFNEPKIADFNNDEAFLERGRKLMEEQQRKEQENAGHTIN